MTAEQIERQSENRFSRRCAAEDKAMIRRERLERRAAPMIGELCKAGAKVYYIYPVGGKYREGTKIDLVDFLIRRKYV